MSLSFAEPSRRDFLKLGLAVGAAAGTGLLLSENARASWSAVSLAECLSMSPQDMASASGNVSVAWDYLLQAAGGIRNPALRAGVMDILRDPAPTVLEGMDRKAAFAELRAAGMLPDGADASSFLPPAKNARTSPQPFLSAPGSGWTSHHCYPGGLVTHTAFNVAATAALLDDYERTFGLTLDRDVALTAQLLHDLHKPWVFQWLDDGSCRQESSLAGTGEHHILSLAESLKRGLPADVVVAQACAHDHPGAPEGEASVTRWLRAAAILAGIHPVSAGLLAPDGKTLPLPRRMEGFVTHLGDHDWVLSVPAARWLDPALRQAAKKSCGLSEADLNGRAYNVLRNYVLSQVSAMRLYHVYATEGERGVERVAGSLVRA